MSVERESGSRKTLDPNGRFGFMNRSKEAYCLCTKKIEKGESRVYDNQARMGPYDIPCAQRILASEMSASGAPNSNELGEKGTKILTDMAGFSLEQINRVKAVENQLLKTNQILSLILAKLNGPEIQQNFAPPPRPEPARGTPEYDARTQELIKRLAERPIDG